MSYRVSVHRKAGLTLLLLGLAIPANAVDLDPSTLMCVEQPEEQSATRFLRSTSLHLRGTLPTSEELEAVMADESAMDQLIDEFTASDAFAERVVRLHRNLLWPRIDGIRVLSEGNVLESTGQGLWYRPNVSLRYRGEGAGIYDTVACKNEPAEFDEFGNIIAEEDLQGFTREGYVMVKPYWDPEKEYKVCAFDAQVNVVSEAGTDCGSRAGWDHLDCGCGPEMRYCYKESLNMELANAMAEDVERRIAHVISSGKPYTALFDDRTGFVNGPLSHFLRFQTAFYGDIRLDPVPYDTNYVPTIDYLDSDRWETAQIPEYHAGILTSMVFLLRFQTNRARANRFYNAFLCRPFQPPVGGLPPADDESAAEPDLQKRPGCKFCHSILEPSSAHWGRWPEGGAGFVHPEIYPPYRDECATCAFDNSCDEACKRFYLTSSYTPGVNAYLGYLKPLVFLREEHKRNVDMGPKMLVNESIVSSDLPTCVARTAAEHALGRVLEPEEAEWLDELAQVFAGSDFDYRALVKAIITSDTFRRVR